MQAPVTEKRRQESPVQVAALSILTLVAVITLIAVVSVTSTKPDGDTTTSFSSRNPTLVGGVSGNRSGPESGGGGEDESSGVSRILSLALGKNYLRRTVELPPQFKQPVDLADAKKPFTSMSQFRKATTGEIIKSGTDDPASVNPENRMFWSLVHPVSPKVYYLHHTLSSQSCDDMINYATTKIERSHVINKNLKEGNEVNNVRTSSGTFITDPTAWASKWNMELRKAVGAMVGIPDDWIEATQVLRYFEGEFYKPHSDYFDSDDSVNLNRGGQRIATALTWLNDVPGGNGGSTSFPLAKPSPLEISPKKGDSVLFYDTDSMMIPDVTSTHGGDPPKNAHFKWVAVLWCHPRRFV